MAVLKSDSLSLGTEYVDIPLDGITIDGGGYLNKYVSYRITDSIPVGYEIYSVGYKGNGWCPSITLSFLNGTQDKFLCISAPSEITIPNDNLYARVYIRKFS